MKEGFFTTPRGVALLSVGSNSVLVAAKLIVGAMSGSVSVLSEGLHSGLDLIASIIAFISVSISGRPADREHPYGHGKVENVSGVVEAVLIVIAGVLIIREAIHKLISGKEVGDPVAGIIVMGVSVVLNLLVSRLLFKAAKKHESQALEADAHHLSTDVITSVGVFAGLAVVKITGWHWLDPVTALAVALLIIYIGSSVLKRSFVDLIDQSLPPEEEKKIKEIIERHSDQFLEYHKMRTRRSGALRHLDLHLVFPGTEFLKKAHDLCEHIEEEIKSEIGNMSITIHLEPEKDRHNK